MIPRRMLVTLHRWVALGAGLLLATMGISGAMLVYEDELAVLTHPERTLPATRTGTDYDAVLATAQLASAGAKKYSIRVPAEGHAVRVDIKGGGSHRVHVDPRDGRLISQGGPTDDWLDAVEQLHTHLLSGDAGEVGVAALGVLLLTIAVTGLLQGWPRRWRDALRIRWSAASPWLAYDLHRVAGLAVAVFLLAQAATGIAMVFPAPVARFVNRVAHSEWPSEPTRAEVPAGRPRATLGAVIRSAERALPGARVTRIDVPGSPSAPIVVRLHEAGGHHPTGLGQALVNPYDATVIRVSPLAALSAGQRMFDWIFPLHVGRLFGEAHRALQAAIGLALPLLFASGLIVWARRRRARSSQAAARSSNL